MSIVNDLLRQLIFKKKKFRPKSYEHEKLLKKCNYILNNFHALEVNPRNVKEELNSLCFKLEVYSMNNKVDVLKLLYDRIVQLCDDNLDREYYLLSHSIIWFLIGIHESMVHSEGDTIILDISEDNTDSVYEVIDWGNILKLSDDIVSMTRDDYGSDTSSEIIDFIHIDSDSGVSIVEPAFSEAVDYGLIRDCPYSISELENKCLSNLQSEYWMDSAKNDTLSKSLQRCNGGAQFMEKLEEHLQNTRSVYHKAEAISRVSMTDYQYVREVLDVLQGARTCTIWRLHQDSASLSANRYTLSKTCKVQNLSWAALDTLSLSLAALATHCLHLRIVSKYIIEHSSNSAVCIAPPLIALGEQLYAVSSDFSEHVRHLEARARGDIGLSLFDLHNDLTSQWSARLSFLAELLACITHGRIDSFHFPSTVVTLLDLLYDLLNQSCLLAIDRATVALTSRLFHHCLRPYLSSLDGLLSGLTDCPHTLLISRDEDISPDDLTHYFHHRYSLRDTQAPLLLHPFLSMLLSTVRSIDLLRILSERIGKPDIVEAVVKQPGSFVLHFSAEGDVMPVMSSVSVPISVPIDVGSGEALSQAILRGLVGSLSRKAQVEIPVNRTSYQDHPEEDMVATCREVHTSLLRDITDRYRSVNAQLITVYMEHLHLERALNTVRSVYFLQAGAEMHDFCEGLFPLLAALGEGADIAPILMEVNLRLQQVLAESQDADLREDAHRLSVRSAPTGPAAGGESARLLAALGSISVHYEAEWGLGLLLPPATMAACNRCLAFLLQLRLAAHCLQAASRRDRRLPQGTRINRSRALRLKLLQISNSFFSYVMHRFVVPAWQQIATVLARRRDFPDWGGFSGSVAAPLVAMARGCLQTTDMARFRRALESLLLLCVRAARDDGGPSLEALEADHRRLVDFLGALFHGLSSMGLSINGLDLSAFS